MSDGETPFGYAIDDVDPSLVAKAERRAEVMEIYKEAGRSICCIFEPPPTFDGEMRVRYALSKLGPTIHAYVDVDYDAPSAAQIRAEAEAVIGATSVITQFQRHLRFIGHIDETRLDWHRINEHMAYIERMGQALLASFPASPGPPWNELQSERLEGSAIDPRLAVAIVVLGACKFLWPNRLIADDNANTHLACAVLHETATGDSIGPRGEDWYRWLVLAKSAERPIQTFRQRVLLMLSKPPQL